MASPRLPAGQQRSGFDQPDVGLKRTLGKPARERLCQGACRGVVAGFESE